MSNYPPNELIDILFILDKCHRNYKYATCSTISWSPTSDWSANPQYWNKISQKSIPSPKTEKRTSE